MTIEKFTEKDFLGMEFGQSNYLVIIYEYIQCIPKQTTDSIDKFRVTKTSFILNSTIKVLTVKKYLFFFTLTQKLVEIIR